MKIFQLIDLIIKLFKLNKRSKVVLLFLVPTFLLGQNQAFWLGKRPSGGAPSFPIVSDNLQAYYDASNVESYPGSGTDWFDLSGNNNTATIFDAQFATTNGGFLVFDGINDYANFGALLSGATDFTIQMWVRVPSGGDGVAFLEKTVFSSSYVDIRIDSRTTTDNLYFAYYDGSSTFAISDNTLINHSLFYLYTIVKEGTSIKNYLNGSLLQSRNDVVEAPLNTSVFNYARKLTSSPTNPPYWASTLAEIYFYSDALTSAEILSNFNATKTRFGL